jgi:hypothetical protein
MYSTIHNATATVFVPLTTHLYVVVARPTCVIAAQRENKRKDRVIVHDQGIEWVTPQPPAGEIKCM